MALQMQTEKYLNLPQWHWGLQYNGYSSPMILCNDIKIPTIKCYNREQNFTLQ